MKRGDWRILISVLVLYIKHYIQIYYEYILLFMNFCFWVHLKLSGEYNGNCKPQCLTLNMLLSWQFVITALLLSLWLLQIVAVLYSVYGNSLACFELCWANPVMLITKRIRILNFECKYSYLRRCSAGRYKCGIIATDVCNGTTHTNKCLHALYGFDV